MFCQCRGLVVVVCSVLLICCLLPVEASSHLRARGHGLSQFRQRQISDDAFPSAPSPGRVAVPAPSLVAPLPPAVVVPEAPVPAVTVFAPSPPPMSVLPMPPAAAPPVLPMPPAAAPSPPLIALPTPPTPAPPSATPAKTSLSVAHTRGSSELEVVSTVGFEVGQDVIIDPETPLEEANRIIGFGSLLLHSPLVHDHSAGAVVMRITPIARQQSEAVPDTNPNTIAAMPAPAAPPPSTSAWPVIPVTPLPTNQPLLAGSLCGTVNSCSRCTALPECGWCALEMKCVDGTKLGPRTEQCMAYDFMHCPNVACEARTTCTDCLIDHGCGWCASTARCAGGDGAGPFAVETCPAPRDFKDARPVWAHAFAATKCEDTPALHSSQLWDSLRGMMYRSRARMARIDAQASNAAAAVPPPPPVAIGTAAPCTALPGKADSNADIGTTPMPMNQAMMAGGMPPMVPVFGGVPGAPPSFTMPGYPGMMWSAQTAPPLVLPTTLPPQTTEKTTEKSTTTELITTTTLATTTELITTTTIATTLSTTPCPTPAPTAPTTPLIMMWTPPPGTPPPPPAAPPRTPIQVNVDINQHVATKAHAHQVHQNHEKKTISGSETSQAPAGPVGMSPSGPPLPFLAPAPSPVLPPASLQPLAYEMPSADSGVAGVAAAVPSIPEGTPSIPPIEGAPKLPPPKLPPFGADDSE